MQETVTLPISEVKEVFELLEEINRLFHQPAYYEDRERVRAFARAQYPRIRRLYYETVWSWLPRVEQQQYSDVHH